MRYRLLVADIDGTLVNARREITPPVHEAVAAAQARGVRVCLATGRIWPSARQYVEGLGADPPVILYNGGMVYDFVRDEVWLRRPLPLPQARDVLRILRRHPAVHAHLYVDDRVYIPAIYVMNKIDQISIEELDIVSRIPHNCPISAHHSWNLDGLLECIWDHLDLIRLYTKPKGQIPDYNAPVIVRRSPQPTVEAFCNRIHRQMVRKLKYAWVWGSSVKHQPQKIGKDHLLEDEDVIQIVKKVG